MKVIVLVDDDVHQAAGIGSSLIPKLLPLGINLSIETDPNDVLEGSKKWMKGNVIGAIVDLWMEDKRTMKDDTTMGLKLVKYFQNKFPKCPVVILSAHLNDELSSSLSNDNVKAIRKPASATEILENFLTDEELTKQL